MTKSIDVYDKSRPRGRPPKRGGPDVALALRLSPMLVAAVDKLAERQGVSRSKMMALLIADALKAKK